MNKERCQTQMAENITPFVSSSCYSVVAYLGVYNE